MSSFALVHTSAPLASLVGVSGAIERIYPLTMNICMSTLMHIFPRRRATTNGHIKPMSNGRNICANRLWLWSTLQESSAVLSISYIADCGLARYPDVAFIQCQSAVEFSLSSHAISHPTCVLFMILLLLLCLFAMRRRIHALASAWSCYFASPAIVTKKHVLPQIILTTLLITLLPWHRHRVWHNTNEVRNCTAELVTCVWHALLSKFSVCFLLLLEI